MPQTQQERMEPLEMNVADAGDESSEEQDLLNDREEPCGDSPLSTRVEALLICHDKPLTEARLAALAGLNPKGAAKAIREAIGELNDLYAESGRSFRVERLAGGYQILTEASFGPLLQRLHVDRQHGRLSPAALETLSIVAYRQPILRAEIEAIRGVSAGEVLRGLLDRRLVKITGRAEMLGRPMLYGTTRRFLEIFGLASLDDLPEVAGLDRRKIEKPAQVDPESVDDQAETADDHA